LTLRDFFERYGPTLAIAVVLSFLIIVLPGNAKQGASTSVAASGGAAVAGSGQASASGGAVDGAAGDAAGAALGAGAAAGQSGAIAGNSTGRAAGSSGAVASGKVASAPPGVTPGGGVQVGKGPCRSDGRMLGIARYMPPCVAFSGDNGGATARGVTGDKVKVVRFVSQVDPATTAILMANHLADDPAVVTRAYQTLFKYGNAHYQTYGREIVYEEYPASGPDENDEAMRADAKRIAEENKAFAVLGGPKVLGQELAARGVICICTVGLSSQFYKENPPYIFGSLPTADEVAINTGEYVGKRLNGRVAKFAGDENNPTQGFAAKQRKFGSRAQTAASIPKANAYATRWCVSSVAGASSCRPRRRICTTPVATRPT